MAGRDKRFATCRDRFADFGKWTDAGGDKERAEDAPKPGLVSQPAAMRRGGPRMPATPAQQARLAVASTRAREAVGRVQQLDPHWRPQSATSGDNSGNYEVMIRAKEAERQEAEARFVALSRAGQDDSYPRRDAPTMAEVVRPRGELVGDSHAKCARSDQNRHARRVRGDPPGTHGGYAPYRAGCRVQRRMVQASRRFDIWPAAQRRPRPDPGHYSGQ